jgi:hypothetical protein
MAKRTIYVLRDSVTGLYYCSRGNGFYSWNNTGDVARVDTQSEYHTFKDAVIHTTEKSIKDGQKSRAKNFRSNLAITDADAQGTQWINLKREIAREREKLPFFGIEIVTLNISDGY